MSIFYDEEGFAQETEKTDYYSNGFIAPPFDIDNNLITKEFIIELEEWFSLINKQEREMESYQYSKTAWDEFTESPIETYVMIGNGFDLECGLPTGYKDFLNFLSVVESAYLGYRDKIKNLMNNELQAKLISKPPVYGLWKPVIENFWYEHFKNANLKQNWIDFEAEIAKVIRVVENNMDYKRYSKATMDDYVSCYDASEFQSAIKRILEPLEIIEEKKLPDGSSYIVYKILYRELRDKLLTDLNNIIVGFETYLRDYVETIEVEPTENIKFLMERLEESSERYVLSFNYTTTFERMMKEAGIEAEFCYVHGKVGDGKSKNRMVLGIDEHLGSEGIKNLIGYAPFRKYNQRIFKGTDSNYMDWLDNIKEGKTLDRVLYIFGHSIGITDKDIIGAFVTANDMRSVLFYHNDDSFSSQVSNLTAIIGMDEMIRRTGGKTHTMEFRMQKHR